jgi:hypothetical protein
MKGTTELFFNNLADTPQDRTTKADDYEDAEGQEGPNGELFMIQ